MTVFCALVACFILVFALHTHLEDARQRKIAIRAIQDLGTTPNKIQFGTFLLVAYSLKGAGRIPMLHRVIDLAMQGNDFILSDFGDLRDPDPNVSAHVKKSLLREMSWLIVERERDISAAVSREGLVGSNAQKILSWLTHHPNYPNLW